MCSVPRALIDEVPPAAFNSVVVPILVGVLLTAGAPEGPESHALDDGKSDGEAGGKANVPAADANNLLLGSLAIIVATIAYAFAGVWGKIKLAEYSPTQSAVGMLICSSVISVLCSFFISGPPSLTIINHPFDLIKVVLGLGVLGTALAYPLYFRILAVAGSSNLMLVTIIVPVFAIILDAILLSQFVTGSDLFGFALVAIGLFIMDGRLNYNLLRRG